MMRANRILLTVLCGFIILSSLNIMLMPSKVPINRHIVDFYNSMPLFEDIKTSEIANDQIDIPSGEMTAVGDTSYRTFLGVDGDGRLIVDDDNQLIIDAALKDWFNFYFSLVGELSQLQTIELITNKFDRLPNPAKDQAHEILESYISYYQDLMELNEIVKMSGEVIDHDSVLAYRDQQRYLKRIWFSPQVVEKFFHEQEIVEDYLLQGGSANSSIDDAPLSDLSDNQLRALDIRGEYITSTNDLDTSYEIGALSDPIREERQSWDNRIALYHQYRHSISNFGDSASELEERYHAYEVEHFTDQEQKRLAAALFLYQAENN